MSAVKKTRRYNNSADAHMRLDRSIVKYKDIPVYLEQVSDTIHFTLQPLDGVSKVPATISANSEDLNVASVPLGYVNIDGDVLHLSRVPARQQKQGITPSVLTYFREGGENVYIDPDGWPASFEAIDNTIRGVFPSAQEAYKEIVSGNALGRAFSRNYAFSSTEETPNVIRLRMSLNTIGFLLPDRHFPTVNLLVPWSNMYNIRSHLQKFGVIIED